MGAGQPSLVPGADPGAHPAQLEQKSGTLSPILGYLEAQSGSQGEWNGVEAAGIGEKASHRHGTWASCP